MRRGTKKDRVPYLIYARTMKGLTAFEQASPRAAVAERLGDRPTISLTLRDSGAESPAKPGA